MNTQISIDPIQILGVNIHPITKPFLHSQLDRFIQNRAHATVTYCNAHCLNLAHRDPELSAFLNRADIVLCDSAGIIWGAHLMGYRIPERITYPDWMWQFAAYAEPREYTFYFLGSVPEVAEQARQNLIKKHHNLKIIGAHHGYFNKIYWHPENELVITQINNLRPNILIVAFGMPLQEKWLMENWQRIDADVALTGGGVFDYLSGRLRRAPLWMTENSLEWLGRLMIEPKRLWKRYLIGNPLFVWRIIKQKYGLEYLD